MFGFKGFRPETAEQRQERIAEREKLDAEKRAEVEQARLARLANDEADRLAAEIREAEIKERSKWTYSEYKDEMRGMITSMASLTSDEPVDFPFPYSGGSFGIITIRKIDYQPELIFQVTAGQFQFGHTMYLIATKADDGPVIDWRGSKAANGVTSMMFLTPSEPIIRSIAGSKRFIIEASFYNAGLRQFIFCPEGLDQRFRA